MAKKPTERRSFTEESLDVNLTPMMNLIAMLIPCLLLSAAFVEIAVVNVSAPSMNSAPDDGKKRLDVPALDLRITISERGYIVSGSQGPFPTPGGQPTGNGPTIPVVQQKVSCVPYVGTWPPPRSKNSDSPKCNKSADAGVYWVYDTEALNKMLMEIKTQYPEERRVIIAAEPGTEYDTIIGVMDASRDGRGPEGEHRALFDEVLLAPAIL